MTFEPGVTRASVTVPIINDNVVEEEESFNGRLHSTEPDISIGEDTAIVTIEDDDGKIDHNRVCVCFTKSVLQWSFPSTRSPTL